MKILFIHPPDNKNSIAPGRFEPLALEVLAATVPQHETKIIDLRLDPFQELNRLLSEFKPEVAGISVNNTIHVKQAVLLLRHIRRSYPSIILLVGGHHPTIMPGDFHLNCVDYIFLGWAEKSFPAYINCLDQNMSMDNIDGLQIVENGRLIQSVKNNWELQGSEIPFPKRALTLRYSRYYRSDMGFRTALVNTSRGCGNRCSFCSVWKSAGGHFIVRKAEDVFEEIASIPENIHRVFFADDNTFIKTNNAAEICKLIKDSGIRKKYSAYCRSDTIVNNPDLMQEWREIGLDNLCVGMEAADDAILEKYNKKNNVVNNVKAAAILNDIGIPFRPHFLIDPAFELEDFKKIEAYVRKNKLLSPIFPILTPIPGSDYYEQKKHDISLDYDYFDYAHSVVPTKLEPLKFYKAWRKLFLSSYSISRNLAWFFRKQIARLIGNRQMEKKYYHYNLVNLMILKVVSVFISIKMKRHCRKLLSGSLQISEAGILSQ